MIYHLRYPALGIDNLRRVATRDLYLESHILDNALIDFSADNRMVPLDEIDRRLADAALIQFYKGKELEGGASNWFAPSLSAMTGILETAGFEITRTFKHGARGYWACKVRAGLPPFLDKIEGSDTYEGLYYDQCFGNLFGRREQWLRRIDDQYFGHLFGRATNGGLTAFSRSVSNTLKGSEADCGARLEVIKVLTDRLNESEADRAARLENINILTIRLRNPKPTVAPGLRSSRFLRIG